MKLTGICILLVLVLLAASEIAFAAGTSSGLPTDRPLTLKECIDYALTEHSSVLSAEQDLIGSVADVKRARSGYVPKLAVGSAFSRLGTLGDQTGDGFFIVQTTDSIVSLNETFYDGGRTLTAIRQAKASARASDANLDLTRQGRVLSVTTAYFSALRAKRLADIAAQTVAGSEEQRKLIQARIDLKDAAPVDIYPVEVQLANARLVKLQADNDVRIMANALRNAVGLDRGPELQIVDYTTPSEEVPNLEDSFTKALRDRPEIVQSAAQIDSSKAGLTLSKLQALPVPTATAGYEGDLQGGSFGRAWNIGIGLTMSLFDGGALAAGITSSKASLQSSKLADSQLRKDISTEVEQSYLNLTSALQRLEASKPNVTLAQKNLEVAREKYVQGMAIPLEIVNAQTSYADALASNAQALYDSYVARAQLDNAVGKRGY